MLQEYIKLVFGIISVCIYKIIYLKRISFRGIPKINSSLKLAIKKKSKVIIGEKFRARNNFSLRISNSGEVIIGKNCFFNDNCSINCQKKITIGENVICG